MILNASLLSAILGVTSSIAYAHPHAHRTRAALPDVWSQPEDSPVYDLFRSNVQKRQNNDTDDSPEVGSPSMCLPTSERNFLSNYYSFVQFCQLGLLNILKVPSMCQSSQLRGRTHSMLLSLREQSQQMFLRPTSSVTTHSTRKV